AAVEAGAEGHAHPRRQIERPVIEEEEAELELAVGDRREGAGAIDRRDHVAEGPRGPRAGALEDQAEAAGDPQAAAIEEAVVEAQAALGGGPGGAVLHAEIRE